MNKADLKRLEKIFASEIAGNLVFQSKSKHYERLEQEGYVFKLSYILPGKIPVRITGWQLTHFGHFTYCDSCKDEETADE